MQPEAGTAVVGAELYPFSGTWVQPAGSEMRRTVRVYSAGKPCSASLTCERTRYGPSPGSTQPSLSSSLKCGQIRAPVSLVIHDELWPFAVVLMVSVTRSPGLPANGWHWMAFAPAAEPTTGAVSQAVLISGAQPLVVPRGTTATVGLLGSGQLFVSRSVKAPARGSSHQPAPHSGA